MKDTVHTGRKWRISKVYNRYDQLYRIKIQLFGWYRIHIFVRPDTDRAHHDHPHGFWTFPLRSYWEEVLNIETGEVLLHWVWKFKWHYRPAEYTHLISRVGFNLPVVTLVKEAPDIRKWGFWVKFGGSLQWVPWREYMKIRDYID